MGQEKIAVREADLGPVIARADHWEGAIEVNKDIFYKLPPKVQEFVLCHEVCHLRHNEWDEARTNALAARLYLSRAANEAERKSREQFLSYLDDRGGYSNSVIMDLVSLIPGLASLGIKIAGKINSSNVGWYTWNRSTQRTNLKAMLTQAFDLSRRSSKQSAADFFWSMMKQYDPKDANLSEFLSRSDNKWVQAEIRSFESAYGFGFAEVTPIDLTAYPLVIVAIGLVVGFVIYKIIKKARK